MTRSRKSLKAEMDRVEVLDIYFFAEQMMVRIQDNSVVECQKYDYIPLLLWDKKNCCLADTSDLLFIAEKKWIV